MARAGARANTAPQYHDASRQLPDRFDTRILVDRRVEKLSRTAFTDGDCAFNANQAAHAQHFVTACKRGAASAELKVPEVVTSFFGS